MRAMALYEFRSSATVELQLDVSIGLYSVCLYINHRSAKFYYMKILANNFNYV